MPVGTENVNKSSFSRVVLRVDLDPRINFAMQQNDVQVIKSLSLENVGDAPLQDITILIKSEPDFSLPWTRQVAYIAEKAVYTLNDIDLVLSPRFLGELTERTSGLLHIKIIKADSLLAREYCPVNLLARNEWSGLSSLPEILAAFVTPNHPAVERTLAEAASILGQWTGDSSLNGYQARDPNRIFQMVGAIYASLKSLGLSYINPPASFESEGQRIRLADNILESRLATCLDIAVFAASCLEQTGIHPLVIIVKGHSFNGAWLKEECFHEPTVEDPLRLRKRVDLNEICVFDTTCVTARPAPDFNTAVREGRRHLENLSDFRCVIDIRRARQGRIRPLPELVPRSDSGAEPGMVGPENGALEPMVPQIPGFRFVPESPEKKEAPEEPEAPKTRLDRWQRKLLDLSLRNRLINFRDSRKTIPILCPDLPALEEALAEGATFQLLPKPADFGESDPRDISAHRRRTGEEAFEEVLREALSRNCLYADLAPEELERRLVEVYRAARIGFEEGGASALYLAVGFLVWYESSSSEQKRLAPILMLPLQLHRKSAREGFYLQLGDDEPHINVTLLEMLAQDYDLNIPELETLPENETGLDVPKILQTFRRAIRDIDRWDVEESARIGLFSFTKYLMWRDLMERTDDLLKNPVVDHLVSRPGEPFGDGASFPDITTLDRDRPANRTYCPLPTDSSQLAAVFAAADGRSFVLEGPPGTGKSQTITNLIAHCLTEGKSVLFVSQKMAALDVVYGRLKNVGLERFCLELHSNKAHKKKVVSQLEDAMEQLEQFLPEDWEREARTLEELRNKLNTYVEALHRKRHTGETIFQAVSRLIGLRNIPRVDLRWQSPESVDADLLPRLRDLVARIAATIGECGDLSTHPWKAVRRGEWTPAWEDNVRKTTEQLYQTLTVLSDRTSEIARVLSLPPSGWTREGLKLLREISVIFLNPPTPSSPMLVRPDWDEISIQIGTWIEHGRKRDALRSGIFQRFSEKVVNLEVAPLLDRLDDANRSWSLPAWFKRRPIRKTLAQFTKGGSPPAANELRGILNMIKAFQGVERKLATAGDEARSLLGRYWNDGEADWAGLESLRDWSHHVRSLALRAAQGDPMRAKSLREAWARLATEAQELLTPEGTLGQHLLTFRETYDTLCEVISTIESLLDLDEVTAWGPANSGDALSRALSLVQGWKGRAEELRSWCAWRRLRAEALSSNLLPLVEFLEREDAIPGNLRDVFDRSFYQWWFSALVEDEPVLSSFSSPDHELTIRRFREVDDRYTRLTRELVRARLGSKVPSATQEIIPSSEMGILIRETRKRSRHMAIRKLFQKIQNLLPRLKPCLLMSPMSVAQFLDAAYPPFDIVVFDEASQIPVWDAVGAIARGKQAVIVGDPKQLPPTSFFERMDAEDGVDDDPEVIEDLESILDECMGSRLPYLRLLWHYRSRHESLIAFSNYHYYDNRLLTFPSPESQGMGVSWRHVPGGIYDKGKSRTNKAEAEAVVSEIVRRLKAGGPTCPSIGVVTFNLSQQMLIEDLLDQVRKDDTEVDQHFHENKEEPVFVKNLENVQGDERDVILFSVTYGPDYYGKVSMNFGPMNRDGGERRLNVAITRARREVIAFSTLRSEQIDLSRTRAKGVHDLKAFLEYAERGPSALAGLRYYDPDADFDSPFEKAVREALVNLGWEIHIQVGCSGYRIDLAVVDPEAPGRYLLGIECDGANYHRAKTARDRDRLREAILHGLGWELHRIWSTDWWTHPQREIEKIKVAIERAKESRKKRTQDLLGGNPGGAISPSDPPVSRAYNPSLPLFPESRAQPTPPEEYKPLDTSRAMGSIDDFYDEGSKKMIRETIVQVIEQEAPIRLELMVKRVAAFWGISRLRERATDRIIGQIPKDKVKSQKSPGGKFLWRCDQDPATYSGFRIPGFSPESRRNAEDLPYQEIAHAALHVLKSQVSLPFEDLARATSRIFGFDRASQAILSRMKNGIWLLAEQGKAKVAGDRVSLVVM